MGYEGNIGRKTFVDVRIVRSKTGHAILKGGSFYNWILNRRLRRLSKNVIDEINSINYQMKLISKRSTQRMKRSEKLVKTYDLPPLKSKQVDISPSGKDNKKIFGGSSSKQEVRRDHNHISSLCQDMRSVSPIDGRDFRKMIYSPAPYREKEDEREDENDNNVLTLVNEQSNNFPHIKVDKCDEKLPPLSKRHPSPPEYAKKIPERSASSNSLEVPSPMQKRRSEDGKCLTILTPNLKSNFSYSESSIMDAFQNENEKDEKGVGSIIKPLTITCGKPRTTARNQTSNNLAVKRTVSRSVSPRPRLTTRTQATPTLIIKGSNCPD